MHPPFQWMDDSRIFNHDGHQSYNAIASLQGKNDYLFENIRSSLKCYRHENVVDYTAITKRKGRHRISKHSITLEPSLSC